MTSVRLRILWDDLRTNLWFRPSLWVVGLSLLALILIDLDRRFVAANLEYVKPLLFEAGVDGSRAMLAAIGGAMLTVASLTFSIMMVAVTQAANAYSPRLLRTYLADTHNQHVLGILIGTFIYSLLVLRVVQGTDEANFVPTLAVAASIVLSLLSIFAFIYFINHVSHSIEVSSIVTRLQSESQALLEQLFPSEVGHPSDEEPPLPDGTPAVIVSPHSGYIEAIAADALLSIAKDAGVVLRLERHVGDYILQGTPLVSVWPPTALTDTLADACKAAVTLGNERTLVQDLHYAIRQLADIALRAISPAINDPTTAINCIDVLASLLAQAVQQPLVSHFRLDDKGALRVILPGPTFESMMDLAFDQIRYYCRADLYCNLRLIQVCADLAYVATRPNERATLSKHLSMVARSANENITEPFDRVAINQTLLRAATALQQDAAPLLLDAPLPGETRVDGPAIPLSHPSR